MVFFDFDNTITPYDVLDRMIHDFSVDRKWVEYEEAWKKGRIGSRLCLEGQLCSLRVSRKELSRYLSRVRIEPAFRRLSGLLRKERVPLVVLSDNFLSSIRHILSNNGIKGIRIYANRLAFTGERLKPSFPYVNKRCKLCAHCKKKNLQRNTAGRKTIIYIGDGLSDICPAKCADIVFAKAAGSLFRYFKKRKKPCLPFRNLNAVYNYFRKLSAGQKPFKN